MKKNPEQGFTVMEIFLTVSLLAVLIYLTAVFIKPLELFKKSRDFQRTSDLQILRQALDTFIQEKPAITLGEMNVVYTSLPDAASTSSCVSWLPRLPRLPAAFRYNCVSSPNQVDGGGWLPLNLTSVSQLRLQELPVDPINQPPYYYTYTISDIFSYSGSESDDQRYRLSRNYELSAYLEQESERTLNSKSGQDNGSSWNVYELGSNLKLTPLQVEDGRGRDKALRSYWPIDEATGTTIYDTGVNQNNGVVYGGAPWQAGRFFFSVWLNNRNSPNDYIQIPHHQTLNFSNTFSFSVWIKPIERNQGFTSQTIINKEGSYEVMLSGDNPPEIWWGLMGTSPNDWRVNLTGVTMSRGRWHHLAFVYDSATVKIYVDGTLRYTTNERGNITDQRRLPLRIGFRYDDPGAYLNGYVDEVRLYDKALNAEAVKMLWTAAR